MTKPSFPGDLNVYALALLHLDTYFAPKVCIGVTRYKFFSRKQIKGESVDHYLADLRRLALDCKFGVLQDDFIRDQIVMHCCDPVIQDRLWINGDSPLDDILAIVRKADISGRCANVLKQDPGTSEVVSKINTPSEKKRVPSYSKDNSSSKPTYHKTKPPSSYKPRCYRCGSLEHFADFKYCPALKSKSANCGIKGRFTKVCKRKRGSVKYVCNTDENEYTTSEATDEDLGDVKDLIMNVRDNFVLNIHDNSCVKKPVCLVEIGGINVKIYADSGSPYTIINERLWRESFADKVGGQLLNSDIHPEGYGGETIELLGYRWFDFKFKGRECRGKLYVAKNGPPVLGWSDQKQLHIILDPNSNEQVLVIDEGSDVGSKMLKHFPKVFGKVLGNLKGFEHNIVLKQDASPKVHKCRNIPMLVREEVLKELEKLVNTNIIEPVEASDWVSPIVVARRSNGKIRLCVDLRHLNNNILIDKFPLPKINEMVANLNNAKWFSTIDLSSAYHQVSLSPQSMNYTSFITPFGCFQYKRMPFGLASAAAVNKEQGVVFFQDDILVFGTSLEEHTSRLMKVFKILQEKGLTVEHSKCKFAQKSVTYLGHIIDENGVKPKPSLVSAISGAPVPSHKEEVRSFLGMAEYCSKYIPNFAEKTFNIRQLLKKIVHSQGHRNVKMISLLSSMLLPAPLPFVALTLRWTP